jgi:hypothetical protein
MATKKSKAQAPVIGALPWSYPQPTKPNAEQGPKVGSGSADALASYFGKKR